MLHTPKKKADLSLPSCHILHSLSVPRLGAITTQNDAKAKDSEWEAKQQREKRVKNRGTIWLAHSLTCFFDKKGLSHLHDSFSPKKNRSLVASS